MRIDPSYWKIIKVNKRQSVNITDVANRKQCVNFTKINNLPQNTLKYLTPMKQRL